MRLPSRHAVFAFALAATATSVAASVSSTQFVIAALGGIDVGVPLPTRIAMTVTDLGILKTLLPAVIACFLPAFWLAAIAASAVGANRTAWFVLAGGIALLAELLIIQAVLGLMPVAGARTSPGLFMQGVAGAIGGYVFARMTAARAGRGTPCAD